MKGILFMLSTGTGGVPNYARQEAYVRASGIEGDAHTHTDVHGLEDQIVCLYSMECLQRLEKVGIRLEQGDLAENFTTTGIDYSLIRPGDRFNVGVQVIIEITKPRKPCRTIAEAYDPRLLKEMWDKAWGKTFKEEDLQSPKWGMSGFYARVLAEGRVNQGDEITTC